ncbi:MAG: hypothetical protein K8R23_12285 [Chthoniobacter sp.]|nr:hypothetical protein [Chthoniobacter sp.]
MQKQLRLLAAVAVLPGAAVGYWFLSSEEPLKPTEPEATTRPAVAAWPTESERAFAAGEALRGESAAEIRGADGAAPAANSFLVGTGPSVAPAADAPGAAHRVSHAPTAPHSGSQIRILAGDSRAVGRPAGAPAVTGVSASDLVLEVGASLHDPAVWMEDAQPLAPSLEAVKADIADQFAASVAAAVTSPEAAKNGGADRAWREALLQANWEYQKFFGSEAANRAGINAGHEANHPAPAPR